jgi:hypothetical protein
VPTRITVPALTFRDVRLCTKGALVWRYAKPPQRPGVYLWMFRRSQAIVYIGRATGRDGLLGRLADHQRLAERSMGWTVRRILTEPAPSRYTHFPSAFSRLTLKMDIDCRWAQTDDAEQWERRLLLLSLRLTDVLPMANGGAWQSYSRFRWDGPEVEAERWVGTAAQGFLGEIGLPARDLRLGQIVRNQMFMPPIWARNIENGRSTQPSGTAEVS